MGMPTKNRESSKPTCTLKRARRRAPQATKKNDAAQPMVRSRGSSLPNSKKPYR